MVLKKIRIILFSLIYITLLLYGYFIFTTIIFITPKKIRQKVILLNKILWLELTIAYGSAFFPHPLHLAIDKRIVENLKAFDKKCKNRLRYRNSFIADEHIRVISDDIRQQTSFIISNHLTNYDWLFILVILHNLGLYENITIILKESLAKIPIFGVGMKRFGYIFIKRNWDYDREHIKKTLGSESHTLETDNLEASINRPHANAKSSNEVESSKRNAPLTSFKYNSNQIQDQSHTSKRTARDMDNNEHLDNKRSNKSNLSPLRDDKGIKSLLLFPEGTIHTRNEHNKSLEYVRTHKITYDFRKGGLCDKDMLFLPHYTLLPRLKGFNLIMDELRPTYILDCTLFFKPFELYPQDQYEYRRVYWEKTGEISLFAILDYKLTDDMGLCYSQDENSQDEATIQEDVGKEQNNNQKELEQNSKPLLNEYNTARKIFLYNLFYKKNQNISLYEQNNHRFPLDSSLTEFKENFSKVFLKNKNEYIFMEISFIRKRNFIFFLLFCLLGLGLHELFTRMYGVMKS